ncbi:MAG: efflux RND transporter periplasmic adaptor subunit [bacterium]
MRQFLITVVVLALGAAVAWRLLTMAAPQKEAGMRGKAPIAVECIKATSGDIDDVSEFTGLLAGKAEVLVSPKIAGRVKAISVNLGDKVKEGQLLATLDDDEAQHAVQESSAKLAVARASLEECEANLSTAQSELERIQTLRQRKIVAPSELEAAEATVSTLLARKKFSEANIQQQDAALRASEARLAYTKITAPISGFVGKRFLDEGAMVSPSAPIVSLADIESVKTVISVVEKDYAKIQVGLKALLSMDAYPGRTFEGIISRIAPVLDADTLTAETEIEIPNPDLLLKPRMYTRVRIHFGTHRGVTLVPSRVLVRRDTEQGIFVPSEDGTHARFVLVTPGISTSEVTEVTGVEPGQTIISMGQHLLNDGDTIVLGSPAEANPS